MKKMIILKDEIISINPILSGNKEEIRVALNTLEELKNLSPKELNYLVDYLSANKNGGVLWNYKKFIKTAYELNLF